MATKEKFNFMTPLHLACSDDELRPAFQYIHFKDGWAFASNTYILVRQSMENYCSALNKDLLNGKAIHADAFKKILKYDTVEVTDKGINALKNNGEKAFYPFADEGIKAPNFQSVIDRGFKNDTIASDNTAVRGFEYQVGLNPHLVHIAGKVLYSAAANTPLKLTFGAPFEAVIAEPIDILSFPNQQALIMPIATSE